MTQATPSRAVVYPPTPPLCWTAQPEQRPLPELRPSPPTMSAAHASATPRGHAQSPGKFPQGDNMAKFWLESSQPDAISNIKKCCKMPSAKSNSSSKSPCRQDFSITSVLGKGAYGKVFQVRKNSNGRVYAMKVINKAKIADSKTDVRHTRTERDVLVRVDHPFLIKLHYAFETAERLYLVQEFCRGGELFRLLEHERMIMEDSARFYLCQIVCALEYLHSMDIVYRDLKTENIMLDEDGNIKLIDFGLSKIFEDGETLTQTFCGTVEYMAPEVVIKDPGHGKPADWWSLGIFFFDLLTGRSPLCSNRGKKQVKDNIVKGKFNIPAYITQDAQDLLRKLLRRKVENRLGTTAGAEAVKAHRFFASVDWRMVAEKRYPPPHIPSFSNRSDATDVSQFDPRFTSKTPRESEINASPDKAAAVAAPAPAAASAALSPGTWSASSLPFRAS